jgi:hypothetical protein
VEGYGAASPNVDPASPSPGIPCPLSLIARLTSEDMSTPDQDTAALIGPQRRMLELIYDTFAPIGEWPLFMYISQLWSDPETDPREIYLDLAERGFVNPVMARTHQFQLKENTNVAVSLKGLMHLRQAAEDLSRFVSTVRYVADRAGRFRPPSATELARLSITSEEIRLHLELELGDRALLRLGALISEEAWQLCASFSGPDSDGWSFDVNLERARRYREIYTVIDFLDISYPEGKQNELSLPASPTSLGSTQTVPTTDNKKVMVVHGRDKARDDLFNLLRALGLEPIEWSAAVKSTGTTKPYTGQAVEAAFDMAQAAVILLVEEEQVALRMDLRNPKDPSDAQVAWQPRPNVFYEGGIAVTSHPDRTIVLELGRPRTATDLAGVNTIRISSDQGWRHELASRLQDAGCPVNTEGTDWLKVGEFAEINVEFHLPLLPTPGHPQPQSAGNHNEVVNKTRVELLHDQYRDGRSLQHRLVRAGGIPDTPEQARQAEDQARYEACKWGQATWRVIAEHFSGYEREFFGGGHLALGATGFALACQNEIERLGSSADTYLERKLELLADLLRKYDSATSP